MPFSIIQYLRSLRLSQQINPAGVAGQQHPCSSNLTTELEGLRTFSLNSHMALFAILAVSGPNTLQPVALTLLIYTISLRLAINTWFFHDYPTLSRFLHVIPLLGTFCLASAALVSCLQSPALAVVGLFLGIFPLVTIAIHQGILHAKTPAAESPVGTQHLPAPAMSGSTDITVVTH